MKIRKSLYNNRARLADIKFAENDKRATAAWCSMMDGLGLTADIRGAVHKVDPKDAQAALERLLKDTRRIPTEQRQNFEKIFAANTLQEIEGPLAEITASRAQTEFTFDFAEGFRQGLFGTRALLEDLIPKEPPFGDNALDQGGIEQTAQSSVSGAAADGAALGAAVGGTGGAIVGGVAGGWPGAGVGAGVGAAGGGVVGAVVGAVLYLFGKKKGSSGSSGSSSSGSSSGGNSGEQTETSGESSGDGGSEGFLPHPNCPPTAWC